MANDVVRFVDSISASPTTRLDLNDGTTFTLNAAVLADPPKIHGSISSNAMTDGGYQSSSQYDYRSIHLELILNVATQDAAATALQNLHRELDRETNYLKWQPDGATKPVFFKTWRTSPLQIVDQPAVRAVYYVTLEIPAEPFALGLRETVSIGTVNNNPAAGSNGCYFDVSSVIGDVESPLLLLMTGYTHNNLTIAVRQHGTPSDLTFFKQAESLTLITDTTNPGGGPDAAMSGTGTNNYVRTSFATATANRVRWAIASDHSTSAKKLAIGGTFRIFAAVRRSGSSSDIALQVSCGALSSGPLVNTIKTSSRQIVDLGTIRLGPSVDQVGYATSTGFDATNSWLDFLASRTSGAETLDWDCVFAIPADEGMQIDGDILLTAPVDGFVIDSASENLLPVVGDPFSTGVLGTTAADPIMTGGWLYVKPNQTNRFYVLMSTSSVSAVTLTATFAGSYWPKYLHVRPASS